MKTLPLLASLAVTAAASAANLKDPSVVARDWNQTIEQAREPMTPPLSLKERGAGKLFSPPTFDFRPDATPFPRSPRARGPFHDAPRNMAPPGLPDNRPPGAKLWEFNGQTYWLVPISPEAGK